MAAESINVALSGRRLILAALAMLVLTLACGCRNNRSAAGVENVVIKGETFALELAATPEARARGLMHRTSIPDHGGMLFVFPDSQVAMQAFWIGNCVIDMDIVYLDSRGTITAVHRMKAEPPRRPDESEAEYDRRMPRYSSAYPAQFAIELQAGTTERLRLRVDERIDLDLARLKALAR